MDELNIERYPDYIYKYRNHYSFEGTRTYNEISEALKTLVNT